MTKQVHDYEPHAGMHIDKACAELCALATKLGRPATAEFNTIVVRASAGMTAGDVAAQYHAEMGRLSAEAAAKQTAYLATPEGKEASRKAAEHTAWVKAEVARGILPFAVADADGWSKCVKANEGDGYGACTLRYAARWASMMEREIANGRTVADVARETSSEADIEGITGAMHGFAKGILCQVWRHGAELRAAPGT